MSVTLPESSPKSSPTRRADLAPLRLRAAFAEKPEVACVILLAALLDLASAASGWWHLAGEPAPRFLLVFRAAALVLGLMTLLALADLKLRGRLLHLSAIAGTALPLLLLLLLATSDGPDMAAAITQQSQCNRLVSSFNETDFALGTAWYTHSLLVPAVIARDDYTLLDGLEAAAFFTKSGWFLGFAAGLLSLLCLWSWSGAAAREAAVKSRFWLLLCASALLVGVFGRLAVGFFFWNAARRDAAAGQYRRALGDYQKAALWDPRLRDDIINSYEIGRLEGALGERDTPEYWAMIGDTWLVTGGGDPQKGYATYRLHVPDPKASVELSTRYGSAAYRGGMAVFARTPAYAISIWQDGHAVDPGNLELIYALALGETKIGQYDAAIAWWRLLLTDIDGIGIFQSKFAASSTYVRPISAHAWSALSWCYFNRGEYDAARQCAYNSSLTKAVGVDTVGASPQTGGSK